MRVKQAPGDVPTPTARDQAVTELRRTQHQLAEAQALAHIGSWDWDLVNDRFSVSDEYNRILGLPVGPPLSVSDAVERVHPDDRAMVERLAVQALTNSQPYTCEFRILRPDGSERIVESHVKIEVDRAGRPICNRGTMQDVTDRKRAEDTLRQAEQAFHDIFEYASIGIFRASRDGRILLANTAFAQMLGYDSIEELRTLDMARDVYVDPAERELLIGRAEPLDHGYAFEIQWKRRNGARIWVLLNAHAVKDAAGRTRCFEGFVQDVTERRRSAEMRRHLLARAISAQEDERRRVARELHDETGQALTAILVGLRNVDAAASVTAARQIAEELRRLVAATLKDVGRIARGLRPTALDDLGLIPALQRYAEELGTARALAVSISGDAGERFPHAVETTLYRIIQEALTNVARHAQANTATVTIARRKGTARAVVRDDGIGFDVGTALAPSARRHCLGLMGIEERAGLLGGRVEINSYPGAGTSIAVELPAQAAT